MIKDPYPCLSKPDTGLVFNGVRKILSNGSDGDDQAGGFQKGDVGRQSGFVAVTEIGKQFHFFSKTA